MNILKKIRPQFNEYKRAIIGFVCIVFAWICWLGGNIEAFRYACWAGLGASAVFEFILWRRKETLISHWIQPQFEPMVDLVILFIISGISVFWIHNNWPTDNVHIHCVYQGWILGILASHFFFNGS